MSLKIGDIVAALYESKPLRSGCAVYDSAVVIQVEPELVLVSMEASMKWSATVKPEHFKAIGTASAEQLAKCMTRLTA